MRGLALNVFNEAGVGNNATTIAWIEDKFIVMRLGFGWIELQKGQ